MRAKQSIYFASPEEGRYPTFNNFERIAAEPQKAEVGFSPLEGPMNFLRHGSKTTRMTHSGHAPLSIILSAGDRYFETGRHQSSGCSLPNSAR